MRLWHKDLIKVLPRQQLLGQWRECCAIAKNIHDKGYPNHILVNKIMDYDSIHFNTYAWEIYKEITFREYNCDWEKFNKWRSNNSVMDFTNMFSGWHNDRYLKQCCYNLQEKYDCGGITETEWNLIYNKFKEYIYD